MLACSSVPAGLASWLCAITFTIPPLPPIPVTSGFFSVNVEIDGLRCGGLDVAALTSAAVVSGADPSVTLGLAGASLNCSTSEVKVAIEHKSHKVLSAHARVDIAVGDASAAVVLKLPTAARARALPVGSNVTITNLTIGKLVPAIYLPSPFGWLDHIVDDAVEGVLRRELASQLPAMLDALVPPLLDPLLANASNWLRTHYPPRTLPEPPPPAAPNTTTRLVDWHADDNPMRVISYAVDATIGPDGPVGLNGMMRLLTNGTGRLVLSNTSAAGQLPTLPTLTLAAGNFSLANLTLSVRRVELRDLDHVDTLALDPASGHAARHSLQAQIGWASLRARVTLGVEAIPLPGGLVSGAGALDESVDVEVVIKGAAARITALLALNATYLEHDLLAHPLSILHDPRCVALHALMAGMPAGGHADPGEAQESGMEAAAATVAAAKAAAHKAGGTARRHPRLNSTVGVRGVELNVSSLAVSLADLSGRQLEGQLDGALNAALALLLEGFPDAVMELTAAFAGEPLRDLLDTAVLNLLEDALAGPPCSPMAPPPAPPPPPPPPAPAKRDVIDWRTNSVRGVADWLLSDVLGARGVDKAIDALLNASGLGSRGAIDLNLSSVVPPLPLPLPPPLGHWSLSLRSLALNGLDTLTLVDPFGVPLNTSSAAADPAALTMALDIARLGASLQLVLTRAVPADASDGGAAWPERPVALRVGFALDNTSLRVGGRFAFNLSRLLATPLASLTHVPCAARPVVDLALYELAWSADSLEVHVGGNDWGTQQAPGSIVALTPPLNALRVPPSVAAAIADTATFGARLLLGATHALPCRPPPPSPHVYYNLSASPLVASLATMLHNLSDAQLDNAVDGALAKINRLYDNVTHSSGVWAAGSLPLPPFSTAMHDEKVGDIRIELANLSIAHADTLYGLDMRTHPTVPTRVSAAIGLGDPQSAQPLTLSTSLHLQLDGVWHALQVEVRLRGLRLNAAVDAKVDMTLGGLLTMHDLLTLSDACLIRPLESVLMTPSETVIALEPGGSIDVRLWPLGAALDPNATAFSESALRLSGDGGADSAPVWTRASHLRISSLPEALPNITRTIAQIVNDHFLGSLLKAPHTTCDVARKIIPPIPPPPMPLPPPPPSRLGEYAPMLWGLLGLGVLILLVGLAHATRHVCLVRASHAGSQLTADAVNSAIAGSWLAEPPTEALLAASGSTRSEALVSAPRPPPVSTGDSTTAQGGGGVGASGGSDSVVDASVTCGPDSELPKSSSLAQQTSLLFRIVFTLALLGNAVFFFYANTHVGATENVKLFIGGRRVNFPGVFDFGLVSSVEQMWQAHAYPLSIIVAFMSGIWTYLKLILVGILFWASPTQFSVRRRGLWLRVLDATGKWCLVDTQMLIILMVALHFDVVLPSSEPDRPPLVEAQVETTPEIGVDTFLLATLSSILLAHIVLHLHRTTARREERARTRHYARELAGAALGMLGTPSTPPAAGTTTAFHSGTGRSAASAAARAGNTFGAAPLKPTAVLSPLPAGGVIRVHATRFTSLGPRTGLPGFGDTSDNSSYEPLGEQLPAGMRLLVPPCLVASVVFMGVGMFMTSFTLHVRGLVGSALGPAGAQTSYSMISLCVEMSKVSTLAPAAVLLFFQVTLIFTAVLAPLLWPVVLLAVWALPLRPRALRSLLMLAETVFAWAMLDVFVVIVAASLLELDMVCAARSLQMPACLGTATAHAARICVRVHLLTYAHWFVCDLH